MRLAETAPTNHKGSWEVGVVEAQELLAKAFVTDVIQGRARLSTAPALSPIGWKALVGIAVVSMAVLVAWLADLF